MENQNIYPKFPFNNEQKEEPAQKSGLDMASLLPLFMQMQNGNGMNPEMLSNMMGGNSNPMLNMLLSNMGGMGKNINTQKRSSHEETPFPNSVRVEDYYKKK